MSLGLTFSAATFIPKNLFAGFSGSVAPILEALGEFLPVAGAPLIAVLCLSATTFFFSMVLSFIARTVGLWWTMLVQRRAKLPSRRMSLSDNGNEKVAFGNDFEPGSPMNQLKQIKSEYQRVANLRAQALSRVNELSRNLESLQDELHESAQSAKTSVKFLESRIEQIKNTPASQDSLVLDRETAQKVVKDTVSSLSVRPPSKSITMERDSSRRLGSARRASPALLETLASSTAAATRLGARRSVGQAVVEIAKEKSNTAASPSSTSTAVGDQWELVMETGKSKPKYALLRHVQYKTSIELPLFGVGVLFSGGSDTVVRRCWADGTLYERFAFHSGTSLLEADDAGADASSISRRLLSDSSPELGAWKVSTHDHGVITVKSSKHAEELVLLQNGFAFFGGGQRGVIVEADQDAEVQATSALRARIGLPEQEEVKQGSGGQRGEIAPKSQADEGIPEELICPITRSVMTDPWIAADGFSYERKAIEDWFKRKGPRSPKSGLPLADTRLLPNNALRSIITAYASE